MSIFLGELSMRPFIVQLFKAYESPIPSDNIVLFLGYSDNIAKLIFMCSIRIVGKRRIFFIMSAGILISSLVISVYGFIYLPSGFHSFDQQNRTFHLTNSSLAYIPTICLYVWIFCTLCGFIQMPWILLSELYPFK